jgi:hypothetical protein
MISAADSFHETSDYNSVQSTENDRMLPSRTIPCEKYLRGIIEVAEAEVSDMIRAADTLYQAIQTMPSGVYTLGPTERERAEKQYWDDQAALQYKKSAVQALYKVVEDLIDGQINDNQAYDAIPAQLIPDNADIGDNEDLELSKRKKAIMNELEKEAVRLGIKPGSVEHQQYIDQALSKPFAQTDPRRFATGRHATKLVSSGRLNPEAVPNAFFYATTDTHGGKTRRYGKDGRTYVSSSGQRIRKC